MGNIPKNRDREELFEEFSKHARKSDNVPTEQANEVWLISKTSSRTNCLAISIP